MKIVWDESDEVRPGYPVEQLIVSRDDKGKVMSAVAVVWFGQTNPEADMITMDLIDGTQAAAKVWQQYKSGGPAPKK